MLSVSWHGVAGKQYQVQSSTGLEASGWTNEGNAVLGSGGLLNGEFPSGGERLFVRLNAIDTDSDGDGLTDWEESQAGTNPLDIDSDHDGIFGDLEVVTRMMAGVSVVNVYAADAVASEAGAAPGTFAIVRTGSLQPLVVPFTIGGTASPGVDFQTSPLASVFLPLGATRATVTVTPLSDAIVDPAETVTLEASAGATYTLGTQRVASLTIEDAATPLGTGLFGRYYNNADTTYTDPSNFNPLDLKLERVDPGVNFNWGNGTPDPLLTNPDLFSIRWTGQVAPQFPELYTFYWQADRGGKLWVNNQLLVDQWNGGSGTEYTATIALEAGRRYDVQIDYRESSSSAGAMAKFSWSSASQPKQVVPANRLYPFGDAPPTITSPAVAVGLAGGPFDFRITATNGATSFGADGLPGGLTLDPATGIIAGTPAASPGLYFATVSASNSAGTGVAPLSVIILETGGSATRDVWTSLPGTSLQTLPLHLPPTTTNAVATFAAPVDTGDDFGERIRGWLTAPATGQFTFFVTTSDENAELWLSASDDPSRKLKRCFVQNAAPAGLWNVQSTQKSLPVTLKAGQRYYIEGLRKESSGGDRLSVGWRRPGQADADVPSEIIPGYCLSPYAATPPPPGTSSLYVGALTPQSGAQSLGSGSAVMTLNENQTEASLYVQWANLTGPKTNWHVHDAAKGGAIIFDFDTAQPDPFGTYHWTIADIGGITVEEIRQSILAGTTYVNIHTGQYPEGEIKGMLQPVTGSRNFVPPADPPALPNTPITVPEAIRFLNQATFGLSGADLDNNQQLDAIEEVQSLGYAGWIDKQMDPAQTPTTLLRPQLTQFYQDFPRPSDAGNIETSNEIWRFWWKTAITGPDQLRHRVAFALSQILVVSENGVLDENATALTSYHDLLAEYAFGNFRPLLEKVTLNYSMGRYLDMAGNKKPDPSINRTANENYAREIMQLFTIGLRRVHPDGTLVLDADGLPVPTYDQDVVVGLANNFTGWIGDPTYDPAGSVPPFYRWKYTVPMTVRANDHHTGDKLFLDNTVIPARVNQTRDLADSHEVLFQHPNVGPFISRQLIQRLVTANPSPGFIYRAARKFDDDGTGTRGNLGAVVRAILLDYEARATSIAQQPGFGHLREPVLRASHVLRALHGVSRGAGQPMSVGGGGTVYSLNPAFDANNRQQTVPRIPPDRRPRGKPRLGHRQNRRVPADAAASADCLQLLRARLRFQRRHRWQRALRPRVPDHRGDERRQHLELVLRPSARRPGRHRQLGCAAVGDGRHGHPAHCARHRRCHLSLQHDVGERCRLSRDPAGRHRRPRYPT